MADLITEDEFKASFPKGVKHGVPQEVIDDVNDMISQGEEGEVFKENFLSHADILKEGKFSLQQYVNAVKFISYRLLGKTQKDSYQLTFPAKYTDWVARGVSGKDISAYVFAYNKSKLVMRLYAVTLVPFHLLNQPYRQEALLKQVELMRDAKSEMVQHLSAKNVLELLAPPEGVQTELQMTRQDSEETGDLKKALADLAKAQKLMIEGGGNIKDVAEGSIVSGEYKEVD